MATTVDRCNSIVSESEAVDLSLIPHDFAWARTARGGRMKEFGAITSSNLVHCGNHRLKMSFMDFGSKSGLRSFKTQSDRGYPNSGYPM